MPLQGTVNYARRPRVRCAHPRLCMNDPVGVGLAPEAQRDRVFLAACDESMATTKEGATDPPASGGKLHATKTQKKRQHTLTPKVCPHASLG